MGIVVLNRLPASVTPLAEWLDGAAGDVQLITSTAAAEGYAGSFPTVIGVDDYSAGPDVPRVLDELCAAGGVERIVHLTEEDVLRAAAARDRYGVPGQSYGDALPYRDKLLMKRRVSASGIRVPAFHAPNTPTSSDDRHGSDAVLRFADEYGWPVVVKPRLGYASTGVRVVRTPADLVADIRARDADDVLVEEFIPGPVCHVDGFCANGKVLFACPSRYVNDCLAFHDSVPLGSAQLDPGDPLAAELTDFTRAVVAALPPTDRSPFHLEVIVDERTGELVFCEIACRLGGGHMMETLTLRTGVNPARASVRDQAGLPSPAVITPGRTLYGWILIPPRPGTLAGIAELSPPPFVRHFHVKTPCPRTFTGASTSVDSVLGFVVEGATSDEVARRLAECAEIAETILKWE
ncbi:ATP-grasp domain-containing protein [Actinomadura bangladeshensis]|uniref:ATP-grasp domain-containing protein n=1 Tax=Actinomadura bangladeshensis TaxID=453573 RepID=UPI001404304E|nr:ATP-grasp domain-containing protein [Actinomadura bangladeshensis]